MENVLNNKVYDDEEKLYLSLIYYRLNQDLIIIDEKIEKNSPRDYDKESNAFKKGIGKGIINPFLRGVSRDLSEGKKRILDRISLFETTYGKDFSKDPDDIKKIVNKVFEKDIHNEAKIMMSLRISCGNEFQYEDNKQTLVLVSKVLFDNDEAIGTLTESLKANLYKMNKKDLRDFEGAMWISLGAITAASLLLAPLGVAAVISADLLLATATVGAVSYMEIKKNEEIKKQFREINPDDLAMKFAIKATIIEQMKKDNVEIKDYLDDALSILGDYRADSEYMMIVEKLDCNNAKKKISICNNLTSRLAEISGI